MFCRNGFAKQTLFSRLHLAVAAVLFLSQSACTTEKSPFSIDEAAVRKVAADVNVESICAREDLRWFVSESGHEVDLENETLPRALFLASEADLLIEKRTVDGGVSRVMIREVFGGGRGPEIRCAEKVEGFGSQFGMTMTGLVKFDTLNRPTGSGFALRQFFFYQDHSGYGVVVSNPQLTSPIFDLRKLVRGGVAPGKLIRTGERSYLLRYLRTREDGVRASLLIRLELI